MKLKRYEKLVKLRELAQQWLDASKEEDQRGKHWYHRRVHALVHDGLNDSGAWQTLGYAYDEGVGIPQSRSQAIRWYRKAWRRGVMSSALNLGIMFEMEGRLTTAGKWFRNGMRGGDRDCEFRLARLWLLAEIHHDGAVRLLKNVIAKGPQNYWTEDKNGKWHPSEDDTFLEAKELLGKAV